MKTAEKLLETSKLFVSALDGSFTYIHQPYVDAFLSYQIAVDSDDALYHKKLSLAYGHSFWHNFRFYISKLFSNGMSLNLDNLTSYITGQYTFYGVNSRYLGFKEEPTGTCFVNVRDPDLDSSGFCERLNDYESFDSEWIKDNSEGMHNQNSNNFKEFLKILKSVNSDRYIPKFSFLRTKIKRGTRSIQTEDGRISLEWSETVEINAFDWRLHVLFLALMLLCFGAIEITVINKLIQIYFPDFVGFIDICKLFGKGARMFLDGRTLKEIASFIKDASFRNKAGKGLFSLFAKTNKQTPLLPTSKPKYLPPGRRALPKARDG